MHIQGLFSTTLIKGALWGCTAHAKLNPGGFERLRSPRTTGRSPTGVAAWPSCRAVMCVICGLGVAHGPGQETGSSQVLSYRCGRGVGMAHRPSWWNGG